MEEKADFTLSRGSDKHVHTFSDWTVTTPAACTAEGVEKRTCTVCGFEEKREIKQLEPSDGKDDETKFSISKLLYKIELFLKKLFD